MSQGLEVGHNVPGLGKRAGRVRWGVHDRQGLGGGNGGGPGGLGGALGWWFWGWAVTDWRVQ
jgi:hypothetical protein